jgi:hypothetical protein
MISDTVRTRACPRFARAAAWSAVACGVLGCASVLYISRFLLGVLPGEEIRPMGWGLQLTGIAFFTLLVGARCWLAAGGSAWARLAGFGFVLSLLPFPLGIAVMQIAARIGGFTIGQ